MWIRYIIYGLLGLLLEVAWTGMGSALRRDPRLVGHTYLWMFFIYGLAAPVLEPLHNVISPYHWLLRGLVWVFAIFTLEYTTGWLLRQATGECPWDYSGVKFTVDGLIRLDYAPAWFVLGLLFEWLHYWLLRVMPLLLATIR